MVHHFQFPTKRVFFGTHVYIQIQHASNLMSASCSESTASKKNKSLVRVGRYRYKKRRTKQHNERTSNHPNKDTHSQRTDITETEQNTKRKFFKIITQNTHSPQLQPRPESQHSSRLSAAAGDRRRFPRRTSIFAGTAAIAPHAEPEANIIALRVDALPIFCPAFAGLRRGSSAALIGFGIALSCPRGGTRSGWLRNDRRMD